MTPTGRAAQRTTDESPEDANDDDRGGTRDIFRIISLRRGAPPPPPFSVSPPAATTTTARTDDSSSPNATSVDARIAEEEEEGRSSYDDVAADSRISPAILVGTRTDEEGADDEKTRASHSFARSASAAVDKTLSSSSSSLGGAVDVADPPRYSASVRSSTARANAFRRRPPTRSSSSGP